MDEYTIEYILEAKRLSATDGIPFSGQLPPQKKNYAQYEYKIKSLLIDYATADEPATLGVRNGLRWKMMYKVFDFPPPLHLLQAAAKTQLPSAEVEQMSTLPNLLQRVFTKVVQQSSSRNGLSRDETGLILTVWMTVQLILWVRPGLDLRMPVYFIFGHGSGSLHTAWLLEILNARTALDEDVPSVVDPSGLPSAPGELRFKHPTVDGAEVVISVMSRSGASHGASDEAE
ncbi:hypothetical protein PLEOSDRAFT_165527 [Pleurotus ostreatus PC15]|uniref:Uncharacterized protein n=1 Tax=Pleurotus ostreatus (strain PC15) TaxID=1137138 RepID=A0A067NZ37_PLEO1|nr:hypothetical protein PLEOSDRAFT_165527 [Pleurotus ostreatus PC15]